MKLAIVFLSTEATLQFVGSPDMNSCTKKIVSLVKTISKPYEGNFTVSIYTCTLQ